MSGIPLRAAGAAVVAAGGLYRWMRLPARKELAPTDEEADAWQVQMPTIDTTLQIQVDSKHWAVATAHAFGALRLCCEVAKPDWSNDEELKALSARVVRAAPNDWAANLMRAHVLSGKSGAWEAGPRSAAEEINAAKHLEIERLRLACCFLPQVRA